MVSLDRGRGSRQLVGRAVGAAEIPDDFTYGAHSYMARLFVSRLNSSSLTPKFLLRMSLSAAVAMVLGYVAGELGTFRQMVSENQSLFFYFALGLFPGWAAQAMRKTARDLFQPAEEGCDHLPLCLVDGLDDETVDGLAEIGIWDIQHLACSNPVDVILRSLTPRIASSAGSTRRSSSPTSAARSRLSVSSECAAPSSSLCSTRT